VVFALSVVTLGIFSSIWMVVVGWWIKRATRSGAAFWWSLAYMLVAPLALVFAVAGGVAARMGGDPTAVYVFTATASDVTRLAGVVLYLVAAFGTMTMLEAEPIGIPLSGVMTFFFAPLYFQYHLYDYNVEGRVAEQLTGFEENPPQI
jgi:cytochrome bd-type quinol oxidase subunit 1